MKRRSGNIFNASGMRGRGMIYGIGTDIAEIARFRQFLERHGDKALERILAPDEWEHCHKSTDRARFLAKRFAAKEALGKAYGTGVRDPLLLTEISVTHDELGKPAFAFSPELARILAERGLRAHLSISDEREFAVAFVVLEQP